MQLLALCNYFINVRTNLLPSYSFFEGLYVFPFTYNRSRAYRAHAHHGLANLVLRHANESLHARVFGRMRQHLAISISFEKK